MNLEERRAIAMRQHSDGFVEHLHRRYPRCCAYHRGFDAALALLVPTGFEDDTGPLYAMNG